MTSTVSPNGARLIAVRVPKRPESVVIALHGGGSRTAGVRVSPTQLSVLRMIPVARHVARSGSTRTAVFRLLNARRGWDAQHTPVADATWALEVLREQHGDLPAALVGHSLGGRAALVAGVHPSVRGVVALNPWVYPDDDVDLRGRRVLIVHGDQDRIAAPQRSASLADRLSRRAEVRHVEVTGAKHAMLRYGRSFHQLTSEFLGELFGGPR